MLDCTKMKLEQRRKRNPKTKLYAKYVALVSVAWKNIDMQERRNIRTH